VTYVAEAGGRHTAPPIRLRWFNLREKRVETAMADGFEITVRGPLPAPPSSFDWRAVAPWIVLGTLLVALSVVAAVRLWPRISRWRWRRREVYLASEAFAFSQAMAAFRARDFGDAVRTVELWSSRLPPGTGAEHARLSDALAHLGAAHFGRDRHPPLDNQWPDAVKALRATRRERLATTTADHALPPLNPRLVT
jgi:hypothetical protein